MSRIILFLILSATTTQLFGQTDIPGCTISVACNYNPEATINDGSCDFISCYQLGCTDPSACNYDDGAAINDGSCDYTSCIEQGCMNSEACNYNADAELDDGSCDFESFLKNAYFSRTFCDFSRFYGVSSWFSVHKRARAFEFENFELFQWRALRAAKTMHNFQIRKRSAQGLTGNRWRTLEMSY